MKRTKSKMDVKTVVKAGFLVAISIVMTRFVFIMIPIAGASGLRISFGDMPIMLSGFMFGPVIGGLTGIAADLLGVLINPQGPYFPGFTLSSMLWGVIPGVLTYLFGKNKSHSKLFSIKFVSISVGISYIIVSLILNTIWLSQLYGTGFIVLLPARVLSAAISIPIYSIILNVLLKYLRRFM
ncbi:folate family ECF transporter S component [Tissierella sp. Yu-01]|uniref:folate family ECF transporter S component n=1 Tax=Tissierella sp. Yu-01 TaxID=3035694 RepID=UPI00240E4113|nr:folate family ECF transporter S component [Tissierella sp. Yu-01]WFA09616.1 folate family ECF transporter S component [Tissierella sp. Yu-01]